MRNNTFQGFRIIFAIGVVLSHCAFLPVIGAYLSPLSNVCFFFMLSGFLLRLTFKEQSFLTFIRKKLFRIWPLHLLMLLAMVVVKVVSGTFDITTTNFFTLFAHIFLIQTWIPNIDVATAYYTISWFLSSLLFCFIVGYFLLKYIAREKKWAKLLLYVLTGLLITIKIIIAIILPNDNKWGYYLVYLCPLACLPDFLLGFILFEAFKKTNIPEKTRVIFQIVSLCLIAFMFFSKHWLPINFSRGFYTIPFNLFLIYSFSKETKMSSSIFGNKIMVFLGIVSFEVYLVHDLIITGLKKYTSILDWLSNNVHPSVCALLIVIVSVIIAVSYHFAFNLLIGLFKKKQKY